MSKLGHFETVCLTTCGILPIDRFCVGVYLHMALTKNTLDSDISSARTYILAEDYSNARLYLLAAEATLQALPVTEHIHWRGTLDRLFNELEKAEARESSTLARTRIYANLRNKRRSTTS